MVEGLGDLAKGGYKLATDANARETAWETTKQLAEAAENYGEAVLDDPGKAYRDARDGVLAAYNRFDQAKDQAKAESRSAEFWGDITGGAAFEVGSMLVSVGSVAKAGKLGKAASVADGASDVANAARKLDTAEDTFAAAHRAKEVVTNPAVKALDEVASPVQKCPVKDCGGKKRGGLVGAKNVDVPFNTHGLDVDPISIPEGRELMEELARVNPNLSNNKIRELAKEQLASGKEIPIVRAAKPNETLYKVAPKGDDVSGYTPYFMSKKQLDALKENPGNIPDTMGLPKSSEAVKYDVYQIKPKEGKTPKVFDSKVASTTEGQITRKGGGNQTIVPNRSDWTTPQKVGEI